MQTQTTQSRSVAQQGSFLATGRGKLTLALLCTVAFLDFADASIVNIALPSIREALHFSVQNLQWVLSGYLLTYGGLMLLGGRAADLLGRRRVLMAGTVVFALASLAGGLSPSAGFLVGARLVQGVGAAMMLPAALSILTTTFQEGKERNTALGVWGGIAGLASAIAVLLGGLLTAGPGWRWVLFVNPPICLLVVGASIWLLTGERRHPRLANFDVLGAVVATAGMLLLVYAVVTAPSVGWGSLRTIAEFGGSVALLAAFVVNEHRVGNPLLPLSIFRVRGLAAANGAYLIALAGFISMFFLLTLYMQNVLGFSPIQTGLAYLPLCLGVVISAGVTSQLVTRIGSRSIIIVGCLVAAGGLFLLSHVPVNGSFTADLLPGTLVMSVGLGAVFVAVASAANAGVPADKTGLAAALLNTAQQVGGALGLAIFSAVATSRTTQLLTVHISPLAALTAGFQRALLASSIYLVVAAGIAFRTSNSRGETLGPVIVASDTAAGHTRAKRSPMEGDRAWNTRRDGAS